MVTLAGKVTPARLAARSRMPTSPKTMVSMSGRAARPQATTSGPIPAGQPIEIPIRGAAVMATSYTETLDRVWGAGAEHDLDGGARKNLAQFQIGAFPLASCLFECNTRGRYGRLPLLLLPKTPARGAKANLGAPGFHLR